MLKPRYDQLLTHVLPAMLLFTLGLWWIIAPIFIYLRTKLSIKPYKSMASYPFPGTSRFSIESLYKILIGIVTFTGEILVIIFTYKGIPTAGNWTHLVVVTLLIINGATDMLVSRGVKVPKISSYVTLITFFASICAFIIFRNCSPIEAVRSNVTSDLEVYDPSLVIPRGHLDIFLHIILLANVTFVVVMLVLEMSCRNRAILSISRGVATVVSSTWLVHVGFILAPPLGLPEWNQDAVDYRLVLGYFSAHAVAAIVFALVLFILLYYKNKKANNWMMRIADPSEVERFIQ